MLAEDIFEKIKEKDYLSPGWLQFKFKINYELAYKIYEKWEALPRESFFEERYRIYWEEKNAKEKRQEVQVCES